MPWLGSTLPRAILCGSYLVLLSQLALFQILIGIQPNIRHAKPRYVFSHDIGSVSERLGIALLAPDCLLNDDEGPDSKARFFDLSI